jgi:predicted O-methyltransferase YrrM
MTPTPIVIDYIALAPAKARARRTDPQTSHDAAKRVELGEAAAQRAFILQAIQQHGPLTIAEISTYSSYSTHELGKRVNEVRGIAPNGLTRNGFRVWGLI